MINLAESTKSEALIRAQIEAWMRCVVIERGRPAYDMRFRLTIGLRKSAGQWTVTHEHHSIPAES
jgi:hypothetical protein